MFNLREYIKKGFLNAIGKMADYQIILNSMGYYEKGVLLEEDLAEIKALIDEKNNKEIEATIEEIPEEIISEEIIEEPTVDEILSEEPLILE